jgi:hypothetical protein
MVTLDVVLHTGIEHPDLAWALIPSLLSFIAGMGLGANSDRLRDWLRPQHTEATD